MKGGAGVGKNNKNTRRRGGAAGGADIERMEKGFHSITI